MHTNISNTNTCTNQKKKTLINPRQPIERHTKEATYRVYNSSKNQKQQCELLSTQQKSIYCYVRCVRSPSNNKPKPYYICVVYCIPIIQPQICSHVRQTCVSVSICVLVVWLRLFFVCLITCIYHILHLQDENKYM